MSLNNNYMRLYIRDRSFCVIYMSVEKDEKDYKILRLDVTIEIQRKLL